MNPSLWKTKYRGNLILISCSNSVRLISLLLRSKHKLDRSFATNQDRLLVPYKIWNCC